MSDNLTCKACGYTAPAESFDIQGACTGNLFCLKCNNEIDAETGELATLCGECDGCRELIRSGFWDETRRRAKQRDT